MNRNEVQLVATNEDLRGQLARARNEVATLRAALGEVVWAAEELLAGGEPALPAGERCTECGLGGEGPLKDALAKVGTLVRRRSAPQHGTDPGGRAP